MFDLFHELFSPGRAHTEAERNRLELTREDVGDGAEPGCGPIDLTSGVVTVRRPAVPDPGEASGPDGPEGPPPEA